VEVAKQLGTSIESLPQEWEDDVEFINMASIFYNVNLIQRAFYAL